jgi:hypothetical protein
MRRADQRNDDKGARRQVRFCTHSQHPQSGSGYEAKYDCDGHAAAVELRSCLDMSYTHAVHVRCGHHSAIHFMLNIHIVAIEIHCDEVHNIQSLIPLFNHLMGLSFFHL